MSSPVGSYPTPLPPQEIDEETIVQEVDEELTVQENGEIAFLAFRYFEILSQMHFEQEVAEILNE